MDAIKTDIQMLSNQLDGKETLPNVYDYLIHPELLWFLRKLFPALRAKLRRRVRLMLFVDDLDRCPPNKIIEVLQSLILLTEDTPFLVMLAVDPRVVVSAIETNDSHFFSNECINGFEYMAKIVQVPFALQVGSEAAPTMMFALSRPWLRFRSDPQKHPTHTDSHRRRGLVDAQGLAHWERRRRTAHA